MKSYKIIPRSAFPTVPSPIIQEILKIATLIAATYLVGKIEDIVKNIPDSDKN